MPQGRVADYTPSERDIKNVAGPGTLLLSSHCVQRDFSSDHSWPGLALSTRMKRRDYISSEISNSGGALRFRGRLRRAPLKVGRRCEVIVDVWGASFSEGCAG